MDAVRLGVIGCGGMARNHMRRFESVTGLRFVAAADPVEANRQSVADTYGIKPYADGYELIASGEVDAVFIGTPHYFHPPYAIAAFEQGLHVLTEKPVAVSAKAAQEMNEAADRRPDLVYAAMFQLRLLPVWQSVRRLIDAGEVGELLRANWTITSWFRTQAYYDSGDWRATWKGEGGGVLINQCPHNLDMFTWLVGTPSRVQATVGLGKYHDIEVEDEVNALLEFDNGATGTFITNTAELPGIDRFEIVGDRSTLVIESKQNRITQYRNVDPMSAVRRGSAKRMGKFPCDEQLITPGAEAVGHAGIWQNFVNAILHGEELIAPGREGIHGLELGNAMLASGIQGGPVALPMDRDGFEELMQQLIDKSASPKNQPAGSGA